jgi:hypothetical protein
VLIGLFAFAFAVWSIYSGNTSVIIWGVISFVVFMLFTFYLFSIIVDRKGIVAYGLLVVISLFNSLWACIAFALAILTYIIILMFKHVMERA